MDQNSGLMSLLPGKDSKNRQKSFNIVVVDAGYSCNDAGTGGRSRKSRGSSCAWCEPYQRAGASNCFEMSIRMAAESPELHLAQKEFNKLKEQLKNVDTIREQALSELEWAKKTVDELEVVNESRDSANKVTEAAKSQIEEAKPGTVSVSSSDAHTRDMEQYGMVCKELDTAKQELRKVCQVSNEIPDAETVALTKEEGAKEVTKFYYEKIELLIKEIAAVNESVEQTKLACSQARKEQSEIFAEKEIQQQSYKADMEESAKKLLALKNEFDPEFAKKLEVQLTETNWRNKWRLRKHRIWIPLMA